MTAVTTQAPATRQDWADRGIPILIGCIVVGAVLFNPALAIINAKIVGLTTAPVVACEILFVAAAHFVALSNYKPSMTPWYVLLGLFVAFAIVRSLAFQAIDVKYLRDVMIIPTFVVLGMTFDSRRLVRVVITIQAVMLIFLLLELINTDAYADLFNIQSYYINTRGYDAADFWNKGSTLFVNATRPDDRFFSLIDLHRLSSVFLEPVSLGNYCMVLVAFLCAFYERLGPWSRWFLIVSTVMAVIGCDGRLAMASSVPMIACAFLASRLPRNSALVYIPGVALFGFVLVGLAHFKPGGDDFPGRIAHTVYLLGQFGPAELLGVSDEYMSKAVDSGLAYLITTQSIVLVVILWAFIVIEAKQNNLAQIRYTHAVSLYIAFNMMVSFSMLSIKTAALLWFVYGSLQTEGSRTAARRRGPADNSPRSGSRPALDDARQDRRAEDQIEAPVAISARSIR